MVSDPFPNQVQRESKTLHQQLKHVLFPFGTRSSEVSSSVSRPFVLLSKNFSAVVVWMGPDRWRCLLSVRSPSLVHHQSPRPQSALEEEEEEEKKSNKNPKVSTEVLKVDSFIFDSTKVLFFCYVSPPPPPPPGGSAWRAAGR